MWRLAAGPAAVGRGRPCSRPLFAQTTSIRVPGFRFLVFIEAKKWQGVHTLKTASIASATRRVQAIVLVKTNLHHCQRQSDIE